jgi:dTDP-4-amino-4,6-dideoxygalactose transaminase
MHTIFKERKRVCDFYDNNLNFDHFKKIKIRENTKWNYSYYPIIFNSEELLVNALKKLEIENIFPRRYFFPSLEELPYVNSELKCTIAKDIAARVICLPLYTSIKNLDLKRIVNVLDS